jgi:conjugative transfer region protein (TIGR03750 family)
MNPPDSDDLLAERLNHEPVVLLGYTDSEFALAVKAACLLAFPTTLFIGFTVGKPLPGLAAGFLLALALVVAGGKLMVRLKRGKPDYYYQTRMKLALQHYGIGHSGLLRYRGAMSIGRTHMNRF